MKFIILAIISLAFSNGIYSQIIRFEQISNTTPSPTNIADLHTTYRGDISSADIDGDLDIDIIITGLFDTKLYINDGFGSYTESQVGFFPPVENGAVKFFDIDGDLDPDLIVNGITQPNVRMTKLYTNDGSGMFTEVVSTPFVGIDKGAIEYADIDGDGDNDLLLTGVAQGIGVIATLYENDGTGIFTELTTSTLVGAQIGSAAFADVDGDTDVDLVITGDHVGSSTNDTRMYINDGAGVFTENLSVPFQDVKYSSVTFGDVDSDLDQDLIITGRNSSGNEISSLYQNNGTGVFTILANLIAVENGDAEFIDADQDNDLDIIITGWDGSNQVARLYYNNGLGAFTYIPNSGLTIASNSDILVLDADNDSKDDVVIIGLTESSVGVGYRMGNLFMNDGAGTFQEAHGTAFTDEVAKGAFAVADIDGDTDNDVFISGEGYGNLHLFANLYTNNGVGNFSKVPGTSFNGVSNSSALLEDIDGDGDMDLLSTGYTSSSATYARLYTNDGLGNFSLVSGSALTGVWRGDMQFVDIDGDLDKDILIVGRSYLFNQMAKLYTNDGSGNFTIVSGTPFSSVEFASIDFSDIDNDGDQDVVIAGRSGSNPITKLYTNNGLGVFTEQTGTPFTAVEFGSVAFADVDNDNDPDLMITGRQSNNNSFAELYTNDGTGVFTLDVNSNFDATQNSAIAFYDMDADSDEDLIITGTDGQGVQATVYSNDGTGVFTTVSGLDITGVKEGAVKFADVDGDGLNDLFILGRDKYNVKFTKVYRNKSCFPSYYTDTIVACDSLVWQDGNTYHSNTDTATYVLLNSEGCDSIITLNLTLNNRGVDTVSTCDTFTWIDGLIYTASDTIATHTLTNSFGCDSIVTLQLTIFNSDTTIDVHTACDSYTWIDGITYTASNTTAFFTDTNIHGCDSIIILDLTINSSVNIVESVSACGSYLWVNGITYTTTSSPSIYFAGGAANGCDSSITLNLTVLPINLTVSVTGVSLMSNQANASYRWLDCNNNYSPIVNETNQILIAGSNGDYAVEVTTNNCADTSICYSVTSVGASEYEDIIKVDVYPNPLNDFVYVNFNQLENVTIRVFNINNSIVYEQSKLNHLHQFELHGSAGIYYIEISTENHTIRRKLVKL